VAHRSRLGCIVIDCPADRADAPAAFWSAALGGSARVDADGKYAEIEVPGDMKILVQAVDHAVRAHLDIEADDKEAEAARLEALGARVVDRIKGWIVMEAPTGHRFCVLDPQQAEPFDRMAKAWEG
jgi:hypothetical protein